MAFPVDHVNVWKYRDRDNGVAFSINQGISTCSSPCALLSRSLCHCQQGRRGMSFLSIRQGSFAHLSCRNLRKGQNEFNWETVHLLTRTNVNHLIRNITKLSILQYDPSSSQCQCKPIIGIRHWLAEISTSMAYNNLVLSD